MTITALNGHIFFPNYGNVLTSQLIFQDILIDAANEKAAAALGVPKTGNITKVGWRSNTVTTGATIDVRLESLDAATGTPSGTLFGTNTNGSQVVASTDDNTWFETTLTSAASVTLGETLGVVFAQPGTSFGSMRVATGAGARWQFPYPLQYTSSWSKEIGYPIIAFGYDDGTWAIPYGCVAWSNLENSSSFSSGSTPDTKGIRFQFPFGVRVVGAWLHGSLSSADCAVKLVETTYNQAGGTGILASASLDKDNTNSTFSWLQLIQFSPVELSADTNYRLVLEPGAGGGSLTVFYVSRTEILAACPGGSNFHLTTAKDPTGDGSWTNYNNSSDGFRVPFMGLIIDGIDIPAGGGGGSAGQRIYAY